MHLRRQWSRYRVPQHADFQYGVIVRGCSFVDCFSFARVISNFNASRKRDFFRIASYIVYLFRFDFDFGTEDNIITFTTNPIYRTKILLSEICISSGVTVIPPDWREGYTIRSN